MLSRVVILSNLFDKDTTFRRIILHNGRGYGKQGVKVSVGSGCQVANLKIR